MLCHGRKKGRLPVLKDPVSASPLPDATERVPPMKGPMGAADPKTDATERVPPREKPGGGPRSLVGPVRIRHSIIQWRAMLCHGRKKCVCRFSRNRCWPCPYRTRRSASLHGKNPAGGPRSLVGPVRIRHPMEGHGPSWPRIMEGHALSWPGPVRARWHANP